MHACMHTHAHNSMHVALSMPHGVSFVKMINSKDHCLFVLDLSLTSVEV